ncbi:MAG: zf-HC2 domain-containing protein [bacterium]
MKTCPNSARLTALREGWLQPEEVDALREHIRGCPACRRTAADLEEVAEVLAVVAGPVEAPPGGYQALLRSTLALQDLLPETPRRVGWWLRRAAAAAAVLALVASAAVLSDMESGTREAAVETTDSELIDFLMHEHAQAAEQMPFSEGSYAAILAQGSSRR